MVEIQILKTIQSIANGFFDVLFEGITMMGEELFFLAIAVIIYWCIDKKFALKLSVIYLSSTLFNSVIKSIVNRPRPRAEDGIRILRKETATGSSFPSGHSQAAATLFTLGGIKYGKGRAWVLVICIIAPLLVAFSRMYLGAHYPTDVLAGLILGTVFAFGAYWLMNYMERKNQMLYLLFLVPVVVMMIIVPIVEQSHAADLYKACGSLVAMLIGYFLEEKFINYQVKQKLWIQVVKVLIGLAVALALKEGLKLVFPDHFVWQFVRYFIVGIWASFGAMWVFKKLFKTPQIQEEIN